MTSARGRILVVEDSLMVAEMVTLLLERCDCSVVGPFGTLNEGLKAAREESISGAVLDINLEDGYDVFPVAEVLLRRGVPMIFLTAYDRSILPPLFEGCPFMQKPFSVRELIDAVHHFFHCS